MKKILSILGMAGCIGSVLGAGYQAAPSSVPVDNDWYWNSWTWTMGTPDVSSTGPLAGDTVEFRPSTNTTYTFYVIEKENRIYGNEISSSNATREIGDLSARNTGGNGNIYLTAGNTVISGVDAITLKVNGTLSCVRGVLNFTNGTSTKMDMDVNSVYLAPARTPVSNSGINVADSAVVNFGDSSTAINSVKIKSITLDVVGGGSRTINFTNVAGDVEIGSILAKTTTGAGVNTVNFTNIGGKIIFGAKDGLTFQTLNMAVVAGGIVDKIVFNEVDLAAFEVSETAYTLMTWTTLTGATVNDIEDSIQSSKYGTFAVNGNSIEFMRNAIPEPAEVGALLGLIAIGFVAYRRRR